MWRMRNFTLGGRKNVLIPLVLSTDFVDFVDEKYGIAKFAGWVAPSDGNCVSVDIIGGITGRIPFISLRLSTEFRCLYDGVGGG